MLCGFERSELGFAVIPGDGTCKLRCALCLARFVRGALVIMDSHNN